MSISLYDLLDVDETATTEQIRAAWKAAVADLDPTDRRFRAYNDAATVLLDDAKRAEYDATLAADRAEEDAVEAAEVEAAPVTLRKEPAPVAGEPAPGAQPAEETQAAAGVPTWALMVAAGVAVLSAVLLIVVLTWPGSVGGDSPASQQDQGDTVEQAGRAAESAAEEAVPVVLSYDYRTLDADFADAAKYLTDDFADQRTELFAQEADGGQTLHDQVLDDKVVVTAVVNRTGLTRVSDDGSRATVVVYVDQDSQKGRSAPRTLQMWATLSMVDDGGDWLIEDICTEDDCS